MSSKLVLFLNKFTSLCSLWCLVGPAINNTTITIDVCEYSLEECFGNVSLLEKRVNGNLKYIFFPRTVYSDVWDGLKFLARVLTPKMWSINVITMSYLQK